MSESMPLLEGDPQSLRQHVAQYRATAEAIRKAATDLTAISSRDDFVSEAIVKISSRAASAASEAATVHERYIGTANALEDYAVSLAEAQALAKKAATEFVQLESEAKELGVQASQIAEDALMGGPAALALLKHGLQATAQLEQLAQNLARAESDYAAALVIKNVAAAKASAAIFITAESSGLDDSALDVISDDFKTAYDWAKKNLSPILEQILTISKAIADVLSKISLVLNLLALIPGLDVVFGPLAAAVDTVLAVVTAISLISSVMLVLLGQRSLGQLVGDAISFAASKLLGKLGSSVTDGIDEKIGAESGSFVSKLVEDGVDKGTDVVQDKFDKTVADPTSDWVDSQHLQLFPSSAGSAWNPPPTIQVAPVSMSTSTTAADLASGVQGSPTSMSGPQPVLVTVGS
jgi:hypothetical protein